MSDRTSTPRSQPAQVVFIRAARPVTQGVVPNDAREDDRYERPIEEVKNAWREVTKQLTEIISTTDSSMAGKFKLSEVAIGVKISSKGSLFGIVEAAAEASIIVKITPV